MIARIQRLAALVRRQHIVYQHRHAAYRSRMLYDQYSAAAQDLSAALFAEKLAENKLESVGALPGAPATKKKTSDHEARRIAWLEIIAIYGLFFALCLWNWW